MKKYITPSCELDMFAVEDIMEGSNETGGVGRPGTSTGGDGSVDTPPSPTTSSVSDVLNIFK